MYQFEKPVCADSRGIIDLLPAIDVKGYLRCFCNVGVEVHRIVKPVLIGRRPDTRLVLIAHARIIPDPLGTPTQFDVMTGKRGIFVKKHVIDILVAGARRDRTRPGISEDRQRCKQARRRR